MTDLRWYVLLIALGAGCFPVLEQAPGGTIAVADDEDAMYAAIDGGRPVDEIRAVSFGVAEVTAGQGPAMEVVHVRLMVANRRDQRPWRVHAVDATLAVRGHPATTPVFINSDIATLPITRIERAEVRTIDFYFPRPEGLDDGAAVLEFRAGIDTARRNLVAYERLAPARLAAGDRVAGWAPYWWCDPAYPWPAFNRRPGRKTHRVPDAVVVTRAPRWDLAAAEQAGFAIRNRSSHGLAEVRLSPITERAWEPSLIAPLAPGAAQAVPAIPCARYDLLVIDDAARRCTLPFVHLCFGAETWAIDDVTLDQCRWVR